MTDMFGPGFDSLQLHFLTFQVHIYYDFLCRHYVDKLRFKIFFVCRMKNKVYKKIKGHKYYFQLAFALNLY